MAKGDVRLVLPDIRLALKDSTNLREKHPRLYRLQCSVRDVEDHEDRVVA